MKGWDLALRYKLPDTSWGAFNFGFDGTYIAQWDNDVDTDQRPGCRACTSPATTTRTTACTRVSAAASSPTGRSATGRASWRIRYIGPFDVGNEDVRQGTSARRPAIPGVELPYGSYVIHSINVGYALPSINSRVEVGVDNVFDKQPPLLYQNNVLNANTD